MLVESPKESSLDIRFIPLQPNANDRRWMVGGYFSHLSASPCDTYTKTSRMGSCGSLFIDGYVEIRLLLCLMHCDLWEGESDAGFVERGVDVLVHVEIDVPKLSRRHPNADNHVNTAGSE